MIAALCCSPPPPLTARRCRARLRPRRPAHRPVDRLPQICRRRRGDVHAAGGLGARFLKDKKDPPKSGRLVAGAQLRRPATARTAINTRPLGDAPAASAVGYFTTVWVREPAAAGNGSMTAATTLDSAGALPKRPRRQRASCAGAGKIRADYRRTSKPTARIAGKPPADAGQGRSADGTLDLGMDGRRDRRAPASTPSCGTARDYRTVARSDDVRSAASHDRAVRLGPRHLPGDHRPAGLRADLRQPDARHRRRASPRDGDPRRR